MLEGAQRDKTKINFLTVINTTWVVEEIRPEKISGLSGIWTHDLELWYWYSAHPTELMSQLGAGHYVGSK